MRRIAVFVEGQTELIIAREMILRKYQWMVDITCLQLVAEGNFREAEYQVSNPSADFHYQIVNIGNDRKVLSVILGREKSLFATGFERVVGLRDMYSEEYRQLSGSVSGTVNLQMVKAVQGQIDKTPNNNRIYFCFAIMETEAWFLGMYPALEKWQSTLTSNFLRQNGYDLANIDPETIFFHPAIDLNKIYEYIGKSYDKHKADIEALAKVLENEDYEALYHSTKCNSFNMFFDSLFAV